MKHQFTLSNTGQHHQNCYLKFPLLEPQNAFAMYRKPRIAAELHEHCVNNQTVTCGVKTYNWSDTSKRWLLSQRYFVQPDRKTTS